MVSIQEFNSTDSIPMLVAPPTGAGRLRQLMLELGCLIKITELLNTIRDCVREVCVCRQLATLSPSLSPAGWREAVCAGLLCGEVSDGRHGG